jgi:phosphatidylglycerol:prolipoprotein diacylglycerol transferase
MKQPDRVAINILGMDIMWYGIFIAIAVASVLLVVCSRSEKHHKIDKDRTLNWSIIFLISGIIGARLYYVIFNWDYYSNNILDVLSIREGGLAIHGGLILPMLVGAFLCIRYKEKYLNVGDLYFTAIPLGQAIGRWGNFFNGEAYGSPTNLPWAIIIDGERVHPTFLYESLWCLALFIVLIIVDNHRQFTGQTFLLYVILYSAERFFVEGLRTDSLMLLGFIKQAQLLSAVAVIAAIYIYAKLWHRRKKKAK